jgi:hypothetical protein
MRNRNIRLEVNQEEALLRAAEIEGRNVSDMIRRILREHLVAMGFLCPTCFTVDCERHTVRQSLEAGTSKARRKKSA